MTVKTTMRAANERGMAMITTLFVMMLMSALLVGFTAVVMSDQRYRFIDRDRNQAFYAASAGIEKLTADLGTLFLGHVAPTRAQVLALTATGAQPAIENVSFTAPITADTIPTSSLTRCTITTPPATSPSGTLSTVGTPGYTIRFCAAASGNPTTTSSTPIKTGPYEGLVALQMPYQLDVTAKTSSGGEVHLVRTMEAVAIPVFQFGIFSDVDLSFFAGPNFTFGGRVHTNSNLFLAQGNSATLTLSDKVTAVGEIIRQRLQNNVSVGGAHAGTVNMAQSPTVFRALQRTEGSLVDGVNSARNEPTWHTTSLSTYNSWIRNGRTGAKALNLAVITVGGSNPDLIMRPRENEGLNNPALLAERLFTKASLRILLSDTAVDITKLPTVTSTAPVSLEANAWPPAGYTGVRPVARSSGLTTAIIDGSTASAATIRLTNASGGVPAAWRVPAFTLVGTTATATNVICEQRTATELLLCDNVPAHAAGATVTINVPSGSGTVAVTATTTNSNTAGNDRTLTFASTTPFAPTTFWVNTAASPYSTLLTCPGYRLNDSPQTLRNCTGLSATPAANTVISTNLRTPAGTGTIGGFIKIERQGTDGVWTDVTMEILNWGIAGTSLTGSNCEDPTPDAIVRIQRLRDTAGNACTTPTNNGNDYWPNTLYDTRQALYRDTDPTNNVLSLGGATHYVTLDVRNLSRWFRRTAPYGLSTGNNSKLDNGGYTVYFSDRRNNRNQTNEETGEVGFEDIVNPNVANGAPNGVLEAGEDVNANNTLDTYGDRPAANGTWSQAPAGATAPLTSAARHATIVTRADAQINRALLFRRGLKLTRGSAIFAEGVTGLSIVSENPVYVQGDWNATGSTFGGAGTHAATAVMADAVTLLSNAWNDNVSYASPYDVPARNRGTQTWYRMAIISGKGMSFPQPANTDADFGTDGGAHNFLRYLENGDQAVNYRGSMATFYYSRQGVGTFKCCDTVYGAPQRNYTFDTDFLSPALLPPNTPMFRDLNTVGFAQEMRPGR